MTIGAVVNALNTLRTNYKEKCVLLKDNSKKAESLLNKVAQLEPVIKHYDQEVFQKIHQDPEPETFIRYQMFELYCLINNIKDVFEEATRNQSVLSTLRKGKARKEIADRLTLYETQIESTKSVFMYLVMSGAQGAQARQQLEASFARKIEHLRESLIEQFNSKEGKKELVDTIVLTPESEQEITETATKNYGLVAQLSALDSEEPPYLKLRFEKDFNFSDSKPLSPVVAGVGVYEGTLGKDKRPVAVKVLPFGKSEERRFKKNCAIYSVAEHPYIVRFFGADFFKDGRTRYSGMLVMEKLPFNLQQLYKKHKLSKVQKLTILLRVAQGLKFLNSLGIIHRDVKPQNIMISDSDSCIPKIIDFQSSTVVQGKTRATMGAGTVGYIAPEVAVGKTSTKSDIFSYGVVVRELLSETEPKSSEHKARPPKVNEKVFSTDLSQVVERCLDGDTGKRPNWNEIVGIVEAELSKSRRKSGGSGSLTKRLSLSSFGSWRKSSNGSSTVYDKELTKLWKIVEENKDLYELKSKEIQSVINNPCFNWDGLGAQTQDIKEQEFRRWLIFGNLRKPMMSWFHDMFVDTYAADPHGRNVLHIYARYNSSFTVKRMKCLLNVLDVNTTDNFGFNALHLYAQNESFNVEEANALIKAGIDAKTTNNRGWTALHLFAQNESFTSGGVNALIKAGIDPKATDVNGMNAIHLYASANLSFSGRGLDALVKAGMDAMDGWNVLHCYAFNSSFHAEGLNVLIKTGVNVNATDKDGWNALHCYIHNELFNVDGVDALIQAGIDVKATTNNGCNVLHQYVNLSNNVYGIDTIVKYLVKAGIDVNATDCFGNNALHLYVMNESCCLQGLKTLLETDINIRAKNFSGDTAYDLAKKYCCLPEIVQLLKPSIYRVVLGIRDALGDY